MRTLLRLLPHFFERILPCSAFRAAGVTLTGPATYFTDEMAVWLDGPNAENNFSYKLTDADCIKGGKAPVKKSKHKIHQAGGGSLTKSAFSFQRVAVGGR
jgi:hypothetical protein